MNTNPTRWINRYSILAALALTLGCSAKPKSETATPPTAQPAPSYFKVDPATAATLTGTIHFTGKRPQPKAIDMSEDPACVEAHQGKAHDESLVVSPRGGVANAFHLH